MSTINLASNKSALLKPAYPADNFSSGTTATLYDGDNYNLLLVGYESLPAELLYKEFVSATPYYYIYGVGYVSVRVYTLTADWNEQAVTYNTKPGDSLLYDISESTKDSGWTYSDQIDDINLLKYGTMVRVSYSYYDGLDIATSRHSTNAPYVVVHYSDTDITGKVESPSPTTGYIPKGSNNTFSWTIGKTGICLGEITQSSASFKWRVDELGTVNSVACGTDKYCTIPADTFTTDSIQWMVEITTNTEDTISSDWFTLSTVEVQSTATAISPKNMVLDGSQAITFEWLHTISTGTAQTKADLQQSTNGTDWTALTTVNGDDNTYEAPANTFAAGNLYWQVRTYNTDNTASEWSEAASCIVVAAPTTPSVSSTQTPRPIISWVATDQQSYQVKIGSHDSGLQFGTAASYKLPAYLADGEYIAYVRVQNKYGLWSEWGSCVVVAANTAAEAITLTATASYDVALSWADAGDYDEYVVYRNGIAIAKTTGKSHKDIFSIGIPSYYVRGIYSDSDNYTLSNTETVTIMMPSIIIADADTGNWITLRLHTANIAEHNLVYEQTTTYRHFAGAEYPEAEVSEFQDRVIQINVAFVKKSNSAALEALRGKTVCVKTPRGEMVIGILSRLDKIVRSIYAAYTFTIRQMQFDEAVEI